ncbi:hypothetical protein [Deinococcus humi]|uniref:Intracellular proteinase inhibitor BsuPI domain-containing protein n=1 Tax=Deinococcus humi TaxID=662880 RepID=A0A7W8JSA1_9DEIO|nr:hypothetical protein [Deinococcus humi]MBB5362322.1 hypothetical protein [Deinococcus humi]GGO29342.1 hypothetical protein GCM10008949_22880 [Deinococcus humi]
MKPRALLLTALLTLPVLAAAQDTTSPDSVPEIPPVTTPLPSTPASPAPATPTAPSVPAPAAVALPDVQANLFVPRTVTGKVNLTFTVRSSRATAITFSVRRDNEQNCATAPQVRVLEVGTRAVVYPVSGASPRLCAQDLETKTAAAKGNATFTRELELTPGEYMVESWLTGFAGDLLVKVPAAPVRITVK